MENIDYSKKMNFEAIINTTFKVYKQNFLYFIKVLAWFFVPVIILGILMSTVMFGRMADFMQTMESAVSDTEVLNGILSYGGAIMAISLIMGVLYLFINAAVVRAAYVKISGQNDSVNASVLFTLRKSLPLLITTLFAVLIMGFGFILLVIPGLILMVYLTFVNQAILIENKHYFSALGRSFFIVRKNFWVVLLIGLVLYFIYSLASGLLAVPFYLGPYISMFQEILRSGGESDPAVMMNFFQSLKGNLTIYYALSIILFLLFIPIPSIAFTLKYLNIRNLKEGAALFEELQTEPAADV